VSLRFNLQQISFPRKLRKLGRSEWEGEHGASILTLYSFPFWKTHTHISIVQR